MPSASIAFRPSYVLVDAAEAFRSLSQWRLFDFPRPCRRASRRYRTDHRDARASTCERHIVTELIGSDFEPTKALIDAMRAIGYGVEMQGITCDIEEAQRRNLNRGDDNRDAVSSTRVLVRGSSGE